MLAMSKEPLPEPLGGFKTFHLGSSSRLVVPWLGARCGRDFSRVSTGQSQQRGGGQTGGGERRKRRVGAREEWMPDEETEARRVSAPAGVVLSALGPSRRAGRYALPPGSGRSRHGAPGLRRVRSLVCCLWRSGDVVCRPGCWSLPAPASRYSCGGARPAEHAQLGLRPALPLCGLLLHQCCEVASSALGTQEFPRRSVSCTSFCTFPGCRLSMGTASFIHTQKQFTPPAKPTGCRGGRYCLCLFTIWTLNWGQRSCLSSCSGNDLNRCLSAFNLLA